MILETTFLIDLERERLRGSPGPAHEFLGEHTSERLSVTCITAGELAAGIKESERSTLQQLMNRFEILAIDLDVTWQFGRLFRHLKRNGRLIGSNDLWIAAIATRHDLPLITRNLKHFNRIPSLEVLSWVRP